MTFIEIRKKLLEELPIRLKGIETYLVSTIFARFNLFLVGEHKLIKEELEQKYQPFLEQIHFIQKGDAIYNKIILERDSINEDFFFIERHSDKINWFVSSKNFSALNAKMVAFYSFKGGLGRTTALVLSALHLARQGKRVALIDFDLEAPGLSTLFLNENDLHNYSNVRGVLDFLLDINANKYEINNININDYYFLINKQDLVGHNGGELLVFPSTTLSENQDMNYIDKLSKINLQYSFQINYAPDYLLKEIDAQLRPDFIFIDTRTGITDISGIVFQRYADISFLFFYGNQQNMFGLQAILEKLIPIKNSLYIVNSPIPIDAEEEEMNYFLEKSYQIFSTLYYDESDIPDIKDSTAPHYPLAVYYNSMASFINNTNKLKILLEEKGAENPYLKMAQLISLEKQSNRNMLSTDVEMYKTLIVAMSNIIKEIAVSEDELQSMEDLKQNFYPRRDYKFIFDRNKFLILGEKGSGKTALYAVLTHEEYAKALAKFCDSHHEVTNTTWVKGLDTTVEFPTKLNFDNLKELNDSQLRNYWLYLLLRVIPNISDINNNDAEYCRSLRDVHISELREWAKDGLKAEKYEKILLNINNSLKQDNKFLIIIYDYIDKQLSEEHGLRGKLVEALLKLWYSYINILSNIKTKIFLRKDIFNREIGAGFTDKSKLNNYIQEIEWDNSQLLNMVWKRVIERNPNITSQFLKSALSDFYLPNNDILGYIPNFSEEQHRIVLDSLLGKRMGANNKAFPYNWVVQHVADTNQHIHPRSILTLFGLAAQKQNNDETPTPTPLRPYNMELVLGEVSNNRVKDLAEEYPILEKVFRDLSKHTSDLPILENALENALKKIVKEHTLALKSNNIIVLLKEIGVLYVYNYKKNDSQIRYHIPDLYLWGLGLRRRGPGAHKKLMKRNPLE